MSVHAFRSLTLRTALDATTIAWVTAVGNNGGSVSPARQTIVNTLIVGLKSDGIWTKLDRLWLFAAENEPSALTDLLAFDLASAVSSPTFTTDRGYASNGTSSYVNTTFNPSIQGVNYQLDSASLHLWDSTNRAAAFLYGCGVVTSNVYAVIIPFDAGDLAYHSINNVGGGVRSTNTASDGFYSSIRTSNGSGSADIPLYKNGSELTFVVGAGSSSIPGGESYVGCINLDGVADGFLTDQMATFAAGGSMTATDVANFYSRLRTYMTAVGVP